MKPHTEAISIQESSRLVELEKTIKRGKQSFENVGLALAEIRDLRLYKSEFKTFEEYCKVKWGWTRQRASQLITAADTIQALPEKVSTIVDSESQARELSKAAPEQREEVLQEAASDGPVTAKAIKNAVQRRQSPAPEPEETPEPARVVARNPAQQPPESIGGLNVVHYFALRVEEIVDEAIAAKASAPQLRALSLACQAGSRKATTAAKEQA